VVEPSDRASGQRQLALLVSSAVDYAIFILDVDGHVLTWNAGAERMQGYSREEIVGCHFSTFYTEPDVARGHPADELRLALRDGRYEEEGWRVRKDGSRFWANVVITPLYDEGELVGFGKVSRDLTGRRHAEEELRARARELERVNAQLAEYRQLVSSVRDYAIFMLDVSGHIRSWNLGAEHLKGYRADEVIGRHFSLFYSDADRERGHPADELRIAAQEGRYEEEGWRFRKDGSRFWASVTITAMRSEDGRLDGFAKVTRDLTARKEAQDALVRALEELREANEELDRFASVAAHDLTGPLSTIAGFASLLADSAALPSNEKAYAGHILTSAERLLAMLHALLAYARAGASTPAPEQVRVATVAREVLDDLAGPIAEHGSDVTVAVPDEATVLADPTDVRALLQNLISNAVKFADPRDPQVSIAAEPEHGMWRVAVEDNGDGIAEADQRRIFKPFDRAGGGDERAGYGLGLAICQRLVDRYGGALGVESAVGQGSRFWFTIADRAPTG
jgi:PAS domain S-box-containing protein